MSRIGLSDLPAQRWRGDRGENVRDIVAEESPIALLYNDHPFAVMLASPTDLEDFALGFALSEGVVNHAEEYRLVDRQHTELGIALHGQIPQARFEGLQQRRRTLSGRSGCGACGRETLQEAIPPIRPVLSDYRVSRRRIATALGEIAELQVMNRQSGGVHAAAFVGEHDLLMREDIGRHNAVDKLIGALAVMPADDGFLLVTSRASYEIVHKAAQVGIPLVAAMSAPTSLAIELADQAGVCLVAFARGDSLSVYCHPQRLLDTDQLPAGQPQAD